MEPKSGNLLKSPSKCVGNCRNKVFYIKLRTYSTPHQRIGQTEFVRESMSPLSLPFGAVTMSLAYLLTPYIAAQERINKSLKQFKLSLILSLSF